jgi:hypothetical protein
MGDFGSTTFGYVIAYVLPGFVASVGAGLISDSIGGVFGKVIDQQNLPLALMGAVGALIVGLFLSLLRAIVVEEGIWRSSRLSADDYASLAENEETFRAYDRFIDEAYRYHQLWGGMTLALPVLCWGVFTRGATELSGVETVVVAGVFVIFEASAIWATAATFKRYLVRVQRVLQG